MIHSIQFSRHGQIFNLQQTNIYKQEYRMGAFIDLKQTDMFQKETIYFLLSLFRKINTKYQLNVLLYKFPYLLRGKL